MVFQASGTRQYFLGIAGTQTGPYTDADVLEKIRNGEVPADALVWYDGLPEWQAISTVEFFREAFSQVPEPPPDATNIPVNTAPRAETLEPPKPAPGPRSVKPRQPGASAPKPVTSFAMGTSAATGFRKDAVDDDDGGGGNSMKLIVGGLAAMAVVGGLAFYLIAGGGGDASPEPVSPKAKFPKLSKDAVMAMQAGAREEIVRKASGDILTKPDTAVEALKKIAREKDDDAAGKEAINQLITYYRQNQRPLEAGSFLMEVKHPAEAYKYFQSDSSIAAQTQAEAALLEAFKLSNDPAQKRDFLLSDIQLLIQPLDKMDVAVERIRLFVKTFPNAPHPYGYYLKNTDEKIADIFSKISNYFVSSLLAFTTSEFAEMHLESRPLVEIHREKPDQYRLSARYKGKVRLRQDLLDDISFQFWMIDGNWVVVETNLTKERQKWAQGNRARYAGKFLTAEQMLQYEQGLFKAQFPDASFHDTGAALKGKKPVREQ